MRNRRKIKIFSSIYKGVSFDKKHKTYRSDISFFNKTIFIGNFKSEIDAALAYDAKARELHGEFAYTNF
jgi:hypothetical protein